MASILPSVQININYKEIKESIKDFLTHFKSSEIDAEQEYNDNLEDTVIGAGPKYMRLLQKIANRESTTLHINLDDIKSYEMSEHLNDQSQFQAQGSLIDNICQNTYRFIELFSSVVDELLPEPTKDISYKDDVLDVILHQRKLRNLRLEQENADEMNSADLGGEDAPSLASSDANMFPPKLTRRYCIYFNPLTDLYKGRGKSLAVREVKGGYMGQLITVKGIVTRVSDVKPSVLVNAYTCDKCGFEIFQEVNSRTFSPLIDCTSPSCSKDQSKGKLFMSTRASKFSAFQEVKIQELSDQVPVGHIPRTLNIHVNGDLVRSVNPGDIVDITGIFLPSPYTGFRALKAGLLTETYLEAQSIKQHKKQYESLEITNQTKEKIKALFEEGDIYNRLSRSIAPEIYGHEDVKKSLLLLLVGGVTKEIGDGMKIRGDINICLMGDPGVAKSQLLKSVTKIAPRSVYTTGRGSSGVGLTAAVMRDPITDEMVLEGGALVLADNGICCIDEFDKMDENDRTAIHEVMEQQTISISKAGITTSLNARTSILAAANPLYGRYNPNLSPIENINLPAALLSRFDILFLILDEHSRESDEKLAHHVAYVHMHNKHPQMDFEPLDSVIIRQYISIARTYRPVVPKEVGDYVVQTYINMRKESHQNEGSKKKFSHVTPRTLLGILRMAQALARIRFDDKVIMEDVDEALRLSKASRSSLYKDELADNEDQSPTTKIFQIIRNITLSSKDYADGIPIEMLKSRIIAKGYTLDHFNRCIDEYQRLSVWQLIDDGQNLMFVQADDESDSDMDLGD